MKHLASGGPQNWPCGGPIDLSHRIQPRFVFGCCVTRQFAFRLRKSPAVFVCVSFFILLILLIWLILLILCLSLVALLLVLVVASCRLLRVSRLVASSACHVLSLRSRVTSCRFVRVSLLVASFACHFLLLSSRGTSCRFLCVSLLVDSFVCRFSSLPSRVAFFACRFSSLPSRVIPAYRNSFSCCISGHVWAFVTDSCRVVLPQQAVCGTDFDPQGLISD